MKICIVGAGMAGAYLAGLLNKSGYDYVIFDGRSEPSCHCAWGISSYRLFQFLAKKVDLKARDYVLSRIETIVTPVGEFDAKDVVTIDKPAWLKALWDMVGVNTGVIYPRDEIDMDADIYVDATGTRRSLMGLLDGDRKISTHQMCARVTFGKLSSSSIYVYFDDIGGYAWAFPIFPHWHIGAGHVKPERIPELIGKLMEMLDLSKSDVEVNCRCINSIRWNVDICRFCQPVVNNGKVFVPIGEAAGLVSVIGEGNIPAMESARILMDCIKSGTVAKYPDMILSYTRFKEMVKHYQIYNDLTSGNPLKVINASRRVVQVLGRRLSTDVVKKLMLIIKSENEKA